jgi:hypothetical protein
VILRRRFTDVIRRQLDLFEQDHADLLHRCAEAKRAYDAADRDDAEERYGDYMDLVDEGTEELSDLRDHYAAALEEPAAEEYAGAFNRAVLKRFRHFELTDY